MDGRIEHSEQSGSPHVMVTASCFSSSIHPPTPPRHGEITDPPNCKNIEAARPVGVDLRIIVNINVNIDIYIVIKCKAILLNFYYFILCI